MMTMFNDSQFAEITRSVALTNHVNHEAHEGDEGWQC